MALRAVLRKEMRDALRDRRSVMSALLFPLLGPVMIAAMVWYMADLTDVERPLHLPVVGRDNAPQLVEFLEGKGVVVESPPPNPNAAVHAGELSMVLVIPDDYGTVFRAGRPAPVQLVLDESTNKAKVSVARARRLLNAYAQQVGTFRLLARGVDPSLLRAVAVNEVDLASAQNRAGAILGALPIFILMSLFIGGMYVATDATAGERERESLEPLLCNPVSRVQLVVGKWLATTVFSGVGMVLTLVLSLGALALSPLEKMGLHLELGPLEGLAIVAITTPLAFLAAGVQLLVATFARSFKEAQTYLSLLMMVPMIPGAILTIDPIRSALWMMVVPTLGQQALLMDVLRGEPTGVLAPVIAGMVAFGLAVMCLGTTARLFQRAAIIFGR